MADKSSYLMTFFYRLLLTILFTSIGGAVGYGLSFLQKTQWKAVAQFERPNIPDLGNYYSLFSTYNFINGGKLASKENEVKSLETAAVNQSYAEFKRNLFSPDERQRYLVQTESIKLKAQLENKSVEEVAQVISKRFDFREGKVDSLSLALPNAEEAQNLLAGFIAFANVQSREKLNSDLIAKWKVLFQQVKNAAEFNLGAIQQGKQVAEQDWKGKLKMMRSVEPLDNQLTAFRFMKTPTLPLTPATPNRYLWLIIGSLVGFLLGLSCNAAINKSVDTRPNING